MNFEIREMKEEDGARVLAIFEEGIETKNATFDEKSPTWEDWKAHHLPFCRFVLVKESSTVDGWAAIKPTSNRACFQGVAEVSIYLAKEVQGKGFGEILLEKIIQESEKNNIWTLQSGIFPENIASIKIHEKLGFKTVGTREKIGKMDGVWRDIVLMERRSNQF